MMAGDIHPLPEVEAMGVEALDAGVEVELLAVVLLSMVDQPLEQLFAILFRAVICVYDEVFDVEVGAPGEVGGEVESGDGDGLGVGFEMLAAPIGLLPNLPDKAGCL
jgi:hypothetical protein